MGKYFLLEKLEFMPKYQEKCYFTINKSVFSSIVAFKRPYIIESNAKVGLDQQLLKYY